MMRTVLSSAAVGLLVIYLVSLHSAFAESITVSGEASDGKSSVRILDSESTVNVQNNSSEIVNSIGSSVNSGRNEASNNSDSAAIFTGNTVSKVTVDNSANRNLDPVSSTPTVFPSGTTVPSSTVTKAPQETATQTPQPTQDSIHGSTAAPTSIPQTEVVDPAGIGGFHGDILGLSATSSLPHTDYVFFATGMVLIIWGSLLFSYTVSKNI